MKPFSSCLDYYHPWRTHLSLTSDSLTVAPYNQQSPATWLDCQLFKPCTMSFFWRPHE